MNIRLFGAGWGLLAILCLDGCSTQKGLKSTSDQSRKTVRSGAALVQFPTHASLKKYFDQTINPRASDDDVYVEKWAFSETTASGTSPWDESLAYIRAENSQLRTGDDLNCIARELGRVFQATGAIGDVRFRKHLTLHCHATNASFAVFVRNFEMTRGLDDVAVWENIVAAGILEQLTTWAAGDTLGLAVVRGERGATLVAISGPESVRLEDVSPEPNTHHMVRVEGLLRRPVEQLGVLINYGRFGVRHCGVRQHEAQFVAHCPMQATDRSAWFEVVSLEENAVLSAVVAQGMAHRTPIKLKYQPTQPSPAANNPLSFRANLLKELNLIRTKARMGPLRMNALQSAEADALLPHLLDAHWRGDRQVANEIALGLLAGWQVDREIGSAELFLMNHPGRSPGAWLDASLDSPAGRSVLLDPLANIAAVGIDWSDRRMLKVVVNSYQIFDGHDHRADQYEVLRLMNQARQLVGRDPAVRINDLHELDEAAELVAAQLATPKNAVDEAAQRVAYSLGRTVWGMYVEAYDLNHIQFPVRLIAQEELYTSVAVTHYKPKGAAWWQTVALILLITPE